jgi:microcystin-dependent protein
MRKAVFAAAIVLGALAAGPSGAQGVGTRVGTIIAMGAKFCPAGWMQANGQAIPIAEYQQLFFVIGTTYGGDGQNTFGLPDLRGRLPIHQGNGFTLAQTGGAETVTLAVNQIAAHSHPYLASTDTGSGVNPQGNVLDQMSGAITLYTAQTPNVPMAAASIGSTGGSQPHNNFQPYLCVDFIISLFGIFPSQT